MESASLSSGNAVFQTLGEWKERQAQSSLKVNFCWINDDAPLTVVANGQLEGIGRTSPVQEGQGITGCTPYRFAPLGLTVPTFAIGNFAALQQQLITVYHIPEHEAVAEGYAAAAEKLAPFVAQWLGQPHSRVKIVELNSGQAASFESGGCCLHRSTRRTQNHCSCRWCMNWRTLRYLRSGGGSMKGSRIFCRRWSASSRMGGKRRWHT